MGCRIFLKTLTYHIHFKQMHVLLSSWSINTIFDFNHRRVFTVLGIGYVFGPYFHFCFELALETWAKASLTHTSLGSWPQPHLLLSELSMVRALWPATAPPDWMLPTKLIKKWCLYKRRGVVPEPVCANKVKNGPASADQGCSLASQGSCHVHATPCWNPPPPPSHLFC